MDPITRDTVSSLLTKIYILETDTSPSVFLEFDSTKGAQMRLACKNASKSWELCQDKRVPIMAKEGFCFGFTVKASEIDNAKIASTNDLVKRAVYWLRHDWPCGIFEVDPKIPRIFIKASDLMESDRKMPAKNYNKIYEIDGKTYIPAHLLSDRS